MAIDGFFIKNLINEINDDLLNSRLEQINLVSKDIFSFSFYLRRVRNFLNIKLNSPHASFFISDLDVDKNLTSNFLVNLKRLLEGSVLTKIKQHNNDRVVIFTFAKNDFLEGTIEYELILELMGRYNNLTLLKDGIIIDAYLKNVSTTRRSIVPNIAFEYFPSDKIDFNLDAYNNLENGLSLSKKYLGISPLLSKYLFVNNIDLNNITVNPTLNLNNNTFYWFNLFSESDKTKHFNSLSTLVANLIAANFRPNTKYLDFINLRISNYEKRLFKIERELENSTNNLIYANYGNYIYSSGLNLNTYLNELISYDNTLVKLDVTKTLNDNAKDYFKTYEKAKRSISHLEKQIKETNYLITIFKQFLYEINLENLNYEEIETMLIPFGFKVKRKKQFRAKKINPLKINYYDSIFYVGLNNIQNEYVTNTLAKHNDYWFHIKDLPGSHVILKGELTDENLEIAAMLALKYSKGNPVSGEVNYTLAKNLRKISGLPGYNVTLNNHKSILINIDHSLLKKIFTENNLDY